MAKVTESAKNEIRIRYPHEDSYELAKELGFSYHTIMKWAQKLGLKKSDKYKTHNSLSQEHEEILLKFYPCEPMESLCKMMNKKPHAIHELARRRGIKRIIDERRKGTLEPLFNKSIESFYWLGFIAADGYVSKNGHFMISQSEKDKENIEKLAQYLNSNVYIYTGKSGFNDNYTLYRVNICDKTLGISLNNLFGLKPSQQKTYTPLDLSFIENEDQALAFLIGFIDGDGSKQSKGYRIMCDESQYQTFVDLSKKLNKKIDLKVSIKYRKDKDKSYCHVSISTAEANFLREFAKKHKIGSQRKFS